MIHTEPRRCAGLCLEQKQQRAQRLILRRSADPGHREAGQKCGHLVRAQFTKRTPALRRHETVDPPEIRLLRSWTVVTKSNGLTDTVIKVGAAS